VLPEQMAQTVQVDIVVLVVVVEMVLPVLVLRVEMVGFLVGVVEVEGVV
jgi:hypothetical protein